jgi:hypothetical protein
VWLKIRPKGWDSATIAQGGCEFQKWAKRHRLPTSEDKLKPDGWDHPTSGKTILWDFYRWARDRGFPTLDDISDATKTQDAGRNLVRGLRSALVSYYRDNADEIFITMPRGAVGYAPRFERRTPIGASPLNILAQQEDPSTTAPRHQDLARQTSIGPHKDIRLLADRQSTTVLLPDLLRAAREGDVVFGSCNTCSDYPPQFYAEVYNAAERGARVRFIAYDRPDARGFIEAILQVKRAFPGRVTLYKTREEYLRVFGLEGREVILAVSLHDAFVGIHFKVPSAARYMMLAFETLAKRSQEVRLKVGKDV